MKFPFLSYRRGIGNGGGGSRMANPVFPVYGIASTKKTQNETDADIQICPKKYKRRKRKGFILLISFLLITLAITFSCPHMARAAASASSFLYFFVRTTTANRNRSDVRKI